MDTKLAIKYNNSKIPPWVDDLEVNVGYKMSFVP